MNLLLRTIYPKFIIESQRKREKKRLLIENILTNHVREYKIM